MLAACGIGDSIKENYPLVSASGSGSQTSYVYRAAGETVPQVAAKLADQKHPEQQSEQSGDRMFLVYPDEIINLQKSPDNPADTLIEVDSKSYVQHNYNPSFLEGYLLASVIGSLFDHGKYSGGDYRGYSSKDTYQPQTKYRTPTEQDKKAAPPVTVNKTGSIFKRSKTADSTAVGSGSSDSGSTSSKVGKILRNDKSSSSLGSGSSSKSSSKSSGGVLKKKSYSAPKVKMGRSKITRRR
ncbi:DUF4247 domain-containing protein [Paenibacillus protaetiae]